MTNSEFLLNLTQFAIYVGGNGINKTNVFNDVNDNWRLMPLRLTEKSSTEESDIAPETELGPVEIQCQRLALHLRIL